MNMTRPLPCFPPARLLRLAALAIFLVCSITQAAKNVILMVADGAGENTWLAASMYQGRVGKQVYDQPGWVRLSCSTYPLNLSHTPTGDVKQDRTLVYDPSKAWDAAARPGSQSRFAGYAWLTASPTDSAAAATALATGRKTYNNAINWTNGGRPMRGLSIAEIAKRCGKSTGVITTVPWSDATPAGLGGAHNVNRKNHAEIANEMLDAGTLDVIMGGGNPDFDDDGQPLPPDRKRDYQWVGGRETWAALKAGKRPWKLIQSRAEFESLGSGQTPSKVLGTAQVGTTFQEKRSEFVRTAGTMLLWQREPYYTPRLKSVPSLATLSRAAINCLDKNSNGFYLMIEGGAVDWANHANRPERTVEEQVDFLRAVEAVVAWIDSHGGWDETLLILTADHESGLLWGPDSRTIAFDPIVDRGPGKMPGMLHNSHGHSNQLVPLFARGPGSERFTRLIRGLDARAAACWHISGKYVDDTDIFAVMKAGVMGRACAAGGAP
ncbi:MAG: alkaline phosphatase [Thermoguttaceae bacterium]